MLASAGSALLRTGGSYLLTKGIPLLKKMAKPLLHQITTTFGKDNVNAFKDSRVGKAMIETGQDVFNKTMQHVGRTIDGKAKNILTKIDQNKHVGEAFRQAQQEQHDRMMGVGGGGGGGGVSNASLSAATGGSAPVQADGPAPGM